MKFPNKKTITKWLRALHRDLGYFVVGITLVYAVSGIILSHRDGKDPAFKTEIIELQFPPNLSKEGFQNEWQKQNPAPLNNTVPQSNNLNLFLKGGLGTYNAETGAVHCELYHKRVLVDFMNRLHYNQKKGWIPVADFFAAVLIFLAVSGLVIVPGKNGFKRRGIWFMLAGFLLVLAYYWLG